MKSLRHSSPANDKGIKACLGGADMGVPLCIIYNTNYFPIQENIKLLHTAIQGKV